MSRPTFAPGLMVAGRADPARLVPITLSSAPMPSARRQAAAEIARQVLAQRAASIHHYLEITKCA